MAFFCLLRQNLFIGLDPGLMMTIDDPAIGELSPRWRIGIILIKPFGNYSIKVI